MATVENPYVKMEKYIGDNGELIGLHPPIYPIYPKNKLSGKNFCRLIISLCIFLFLLILNLMLIYFYLFTATNSQVPSYTVENLHLKSFNSTSNLTSQTQFLVTVKADNPNTDIGFILSGEDSAVNVVYNDTDVCSGKLPHFIQGPMNVTVMKVELVGKSELGAALQEAASRNNSQSQIPLLVKVKVPVRIVAGEYPLSDFRAFVNCTLVVDNLAPNRKINILSSNTTIGYEFQ